MQRAGAKAPFSAPATPRATPIATTAKGIPGSGTASAPPAATEAGAGMADELVLENQLAQSRSPYVSFEHGAWAGVAATTAVGGFGTKAKIWFTR